MKSCNIFFKNFDTHPPRPHTKDTAVSVAETQARVVAERLLAGGHAARSGGRKRSAKTLRAAEGAEATAGSNTLRFSQKDGTQIAALVQLVDGTCRAAPTAKTVNNSSTWLERAETLGFLALAAISGGVAQQEDDALEGDGEDLV
jgi:hypothetical protein